MKAIKLLIVLFSLTLMSTGCRHEHPHDEKSKTEKSGHSHGKDDKRHENHRH